MKLIAITFLSLLFNSFCLAQKTPLPSDCGATTIFADMKGDGDKEKIILNKAFEDNRCLFQNLTIYDQDHPVYQTVNEGLTDGFGHLSGFEVKPLRKGGASQIFLDIYGNDAAGSYAKVIEWVDGKFVETMSENNLGTASIQDLEGDGNFQVILTEYKSNYSDHLPNIYDFDLLSKKYIISSEKHLSFFRRLILNSEAYIKEHPEKGAECCARETSLGKIINAYLLLGDKEKAKDASERLSDVYVEYGKASYYEKNYRYAIVNYSKAIEKNAENYTAFGLRGYSYLRMHDAKSAVDSLEQSITVNPNYVEGHCNLALAYWAAGKKKKALNEIKKVVDLDPTFKTKIKEDSQFKVFKHSVKFNELMGS